MPYKLRKRDGKWCVVKKDDPDGKSLGCHDDRADALKQLSALYANEPSAGMSAIPVSTPDIDPVLMAKKSSLSYNDRRELLQAAIAANAPKNADGMAYNCYVRDFDDSSVVYSEGYGPGSMYQQDYTIEDGKVKLGDRTTVREKTTYVPVVQGSASYSMVATFSSTGEWVVREGKLFEAGDFPDKKFAMTPLELEEAVERFKAARPTVKVDLEHTPTVLDGKLGHVDDVWVDEDGVSLFGRVAFPTWLDQALGKDGRKVSATWDRMTKDLVGLALVVEPRITDAALMTAFSTAGQPASSAPESGKVSIGGRLMAGATDMWKAFWEAAFGSDSMTPEQLASILANAGNGAAPQATGGTQGQSSQPATTEAQPTGNAGTFAGQQPALPATISTVVQYANQAAAASSAQEQLRAQMERLQGDYIKQMSVAFADRQIVVEKKAMPNERDAIIAAFTQAAWDDYRQPTKVTFGQGVEGSRVDALEFVYACRSAHSLTVEQVGESDLSTRGGVVFNKTKTPEKDAADANTAAPADDIQKLLAMSNLGQAVLAAKKPAQTSA